MLRSMLARSSSSAKQALFRRGSDPERKVAIFRATGEIGQPLGLLTKLNPLFSNLSFCDVTNNTGVASDVSHINTRSGAVVKKSCGVANLDVVGAKTFYAGKAKVPLAGFGTGLCVARSVAASPTCRRHFTTQLKNPESANVTDGTFAVFESIIKPPGSEEQTYVLKVGWPLTEQDHERFEKFAKETSEKICVALLETIQKTEKKLKERAEEENKLVEDKK